jgi:hypothetical protein
MSVDETVGWIGIKPLLSSMRGNRGLEATMAANVATKIVDKLILARVGLR